MRQGVEESTYLMLRTYIDKYASIFYSYSCVIVFHNLYKVLNTPLHVFDRWIEK